MVILPGIRVIVRGFLCIVRGFLRHLSKKFYVHVLAQCALPCWSRVNKVFLAAGGDSCGTTLKQPTG